MERLGYSTTHTKWWHLRGGKQEEEEEVEDSTE
jgi:hypothetical protein